MGLGVGVGLSLPPLPPPLNQEQPDITAINKSPNSNAIMPESKYSLLMLSSLFPLVCRSVPLVRGPLYLSLCLSALQAGKHLLIEKPLAVKIEEALKIHQEAEKTKKIVMVGMKFRFYSLIKKARQLVPNPFMVSVQVLDDPWTEDFWANDPILGGGNVISQGVIYSFRTTFVF